MSEENKTREPKQKRSIEKKEKILKAAYKLICQEGYYKTTTSEIAAEAGVSIGCLYSYFKDKHMIMMELLEDYQRQFDELRNKFISEMTSCNAPEKWFREFMLMLIDIHERTINFQKELKALYYYDKEIAASTDEETKKIQSIALNTLKLYKGHNIEITDYEAAAIVLTTIINSVVDRISLYPNIIEKDRILDEAIKALCSYLKMPTEKHLQ